MDDQTANDECGICLETLMAAVTLPCTHKFCAICLDGWKSKFGASWDDMIQVHKSKSCPICREKIPPSKDLIISLNYHRNLKRRCEARGDTSSLMYMNEVQNVQQLEEEVGDYVGEGLDYDGKQYMEIPKEIFKALEKNNIKKVMKWLGSPVDMKRVYSKYPNHVNSTLVHLAAEYDDSEDSSNLLSIVLQYGADVNEVDAKGWSPLLVANSIQKTPFHRLRLLLEWGADLCMPSKFSGIIPRDNTRSEKDIFIEFISLHNPKLTKLVSSEFGGRRCEVINLPNHPQLNGKACVVEKYIAKKDKYKIIFEGSGDAALVGPNNLKRRDRTPFDCGYYISFKKGRMSRREFATKEECQAYVSSLGDSNGDIKNAEELASLKL